jgi:thymidine kinase
MNDNTIMTGYLKVILGCMFSGKTTELIKEYNRHKSCDLRCCFINHSTDDRYGSGGKVTKTHNNQDILNDKSCNRLDEIFCNTSIHNDYDVFFINEGQFFSDLYEYVDFLVNIHGKKVYVCGLDGDFERKEFGSILKIIPLCDDIIKLKAICKNCKNKEGIFTFRMNGQLKQTIVGADIYSALCRDCYNFSTNPEEKV